MRTWLFVLLCLPTLLKAQSGHNHAHEKQPGAPLPPFKQYNFIAPFQLTAYTGQVFTKNDIPKGRPTMVFLFSVECDHCAHMTEDILKNIDKFKKSNILMVTPFKLERMKAWYDQYKIGNYPNIIMAAEPTRQIVYYYDLHNFPGVYLYNRKGQLEADYEGTVKLDTVLKHL
ncbi:peroxiredoxin family protein [Chitinophaga rhizosphaerae]|uniref:peroxiredoxin family protein n=1 Tax=Chitinophaga rhizosphaerae TaxID=1864947 RepID=UPI000F8027A5|nr:redoxin domain-containing protein [Chitinophaga rhizosphaerae]